MCVYGLAHGGCQICVCLFWSSSAFQTGTPGTSQRRISLQMGLRLSFATFAISWKPSPESLGFFGPSPFLGLTNQATLSLAEFTRTGRPKTGAAHLKLCLSKRLGSSASHQRVRFKFTLGAACFDGKPSAAWQQIRSKTTLRFVCWGSIADTMKLAP